MVGWASMFVDLNVRMHSTRKSTGMEFFSDIIKDLELIDLLLQGTQFTWSRGVNSLKLQE